ncbi:MAG: hypothetical protein ACPGU1_10875 [Myxococcota bacterium]
MSDEQPDAENQAVESWRKEGRCSSCVYFETDYGADPDFYGHCKMYPRTGSRESSDWACAEYGPLDGFDRLTKSTSRELDIALAKEKARKNPPPVRQQGIRRRVTNDSSARRSPAVVKRSPVNSMPSMADLMAKRGQTAPSPPPTEPARPAPPVVPRETPSARAPRPIASEPQPFRSRVVEPAPAPSRPAPPHSPAPAHTGGLDMSPDDLRDVLMEVMESAMSVEEVDIASRWEDGSLILEPANPDQQPTVLPIETFWNKIIMVRDRLRVLEQKINSNANLSNADKVDMQQYISRCYGSLTTFNVLFKNREDRFSSK